MKLGIIVSEWYFEDITGKMLELAERTCEEKGIAFTTVKVPGCFEIPLAASRLLKDVDGIVTLGAIIKGETSHDEVIGNAVAKQLLEISIGAGKPIVLGINGPGITRAQAIARIPRAREVTLACIEMAQ